MSLSHVFFLRQSRGLGDVYKRQRLARETIAPGFDDVDVAALAAGLQAGLPGLDLAGRPLAAGHLSLIHI
ncbi:hypothetical protein AERO_18715 [Aeromicrobium fastidiosum]|uniref:hypothetical protein n=1 Tax=Aeromicrobium fastidiosum TaxID=52699 RepID=UPI00202380C8|nr:hypothetical protein [Aeromicrobium fastidiosum]MCL8253417.1 hypothetical protein [Aeromicrobium fastidiosum]